MPWAIISQNHFRLGLNLSWAIIWVWALNWDFTVLHLSKNYLSLYNLQNLSGTIVSIISIISLALSPNPRTAAIYYFITALFILLACFDTYFALPLNVKPHSRKYFLKNSFKNLIFCYRDFFGTMITYSTKLYMRRNDETQFMLCHIFVFSRDASHNVSMCSWHTLSRWQSFQQC